jgi:hypothetical protein
LLNGFSPTLDSGVRLLQAHNCSVVSLLTGQYFEHGRRNDVARSKSEHINGSVFTISVEEIKLP